MTHNRSATVLIHVSLWECRTILILAPTAVFEIRNLPQITNTRNVFFRRPTQGEGVAVRSRRVGALQGPLGKANGALIERLEQNRWILRFHSEPSAKCVSERCGENELRCG